MPSFSCRDDTNIDDVRFPATIECDNCKEEFPIVWLWLLYFFLFFFPSHYAGNMGITNRNLPRVQSAFPFRINFSFGYMGQSLGRKAKIIAPSLNNLRIIQLLMQSWGGSTESSKNCSKFVINILLILIITVNFSLFFVLFFCFFFVTVLLLCDGI